MSRETKHVDLTYLEGMSEGNDELIKEMVIIFKKQVPEFIKEMEIYLERKDWASLGAIAHKAKSSVYIMGMGDLADDLKTLETAAKKSQNIESYPDHVVRFKSRCNLALEELETLFL